MYQDFRQNLTDPENLPDLVIPVIQEDLEVLDFLLPRLLQLIQRVLQVLLVLHYRPVLPDQPLLLDPLLQLNQEFQLLRSIPVRQLQKVQLDL